MKKGTIWMSLGLLMIIAALGLTVYNIRDDKRAGEESDAVVESINEIISENVEEADKSDEEPLYVQHPDMEMPTILIDGRYYIGVLEIPALGLSVPVMESWSYPNLKISPCRYEGSAYTGDLIIAGHDYNSHFGNLKSLISGDQVRFTDVDGNQFIYEVVGTEVLVASAVEEMKSGEWELTLFTCTYSGSSRTTVRLALIS